MSGETDQNLASKFESWLKEQGSDPACQTHDNEPEKIVETFPVKGDRKITEQFLKDRFWWWRKANDQDYREIFKQQGNRFWADILYPIYRDRFSLSAYRYELLARCQSTPG